MDIHQTCMDISLGQASDLNRFCDFVLVFKAIEHLSWRVQFSDKNVSLVSDWVYLLGKPKRCLGLCDLDPSFKVTGARS